MNEAARRRIARRVSAPVYPRQLCEACGARLFDVVERHGSIISIVCRRCGRRADITV